MRHVLKLVAPMLAFAIIANAQGAAQDALPTALVGRWEGTAALDSGAVGQGAIVRLTIAQDGTVTGTVGDATLANARIGRNRSLFSRVLGLGTRWMIDGALVGPLITATGLKRERTRMPVDHVGETLVGDFNATGGGKVLSVRMRLAKVP
jgi:hypothetical protein